jgi:glycosyltransferase involved in cell wall biosynthesis
VKKHIVFITQPYQATDNACAVSTSSRKAVLEELGFKVTLYHFSYHNFFRDFFNLLKLLKNKDILYIRLDGSCALEKFTLLKLTKPKIKLIWEIYAKSDEHLTSEDKHKIQLGVLKNKLKRLLLARFVDVSISISEQIKEYSLRKLNIKNSFLLPVFVQTDLIKKVKKIEELKQNTLISFCNNKNYYKIFWGGGAQYKWQAIDLIEKVAKKIYLIDKSIIFIIVGSNRWHHFSFFNNILFIETLPHFMFLSMANNSDICLALYHYDKIRTPYYFCSSKLLEYMSLGKAVIVSEAGPIKGSRQLVLDRHIVVDNFNGFITDNSVKDIVNKILYLKSYKKFANKIGFNAKKTILEERSSIQAKKQYKYIFEQTNLL